MSPHDIVAPSPWVVRWAPRLTRGGRVLDLACGGGRHARYLLSLGHDVTAVDRVACRLMGFDPDAIPLTREPLRPMRHKITALEPGKPIACVRDGQDCSDEDLQPVLGRPFDPPAGWRSYFASPAVRSGADTGR